MDFFKNVLYNDYAIFAEGNMKTKYINWIVIACVMVVSFILGICIMCLPSSSDDLNGFSAENAANYLKTISQKPHSVFDAENA